jgi:hypothetical protein
MEKDFSFRDSYDHGTRSFGGDVKGVFEIFQWEKEEDLCTLTPTRLKHETHTKARALSYTQI